MSVHTQETIKRVSVPDIASRKGGEPIVCLTAYDAPMAGLLDPHCDVLLVGDSLGMAVHGLPNTVGVPLAMMSPLRSWLGPHRCSKMDRCWFIRPPSPMR